LTKQPYSPNQASIGITRLRNREKEDATFLLGPADEKENPYINSGGNRQQTSTRRQFLQYCTTPAAALGLSQTDLLKSDKAPAAAGGFWCKSPLFPPDFAWAGTSVLTLKQKILFIWIPANTFLAPWFPRTAHAIGFRRAPPFICVTAGWRCDVQPPGIQQRFALVGSAMTVLDQSFSPEPGNEGLFLYL